jgi:hypothetical protein
MILKWPWKEIPKDNETWEECKKQFEKALFLLMESSLPGVDAREEVRQFLVEVTEKHKPERSITLEEFKNLPLSSGLVVRKPGTKWVLGSKECHEKQIQGVEGGLDDTVFFLEYKGEGKAVVDGVPTVDIEVVQASIVQ